MRKMTLFGTSFFLLIALAGCRQNQYQEVVKETYIHNYGVPVAKPDWEKEGKNGQIVQLRKDGVTVTQTFDNGTLDGETTYTFPNSSSIHWVEVYNNNELKAKREHFPSGVPMREEMYERGMLVKLTRWYEDGTPASIESYQGYYLLKGEYRTPLNAVESNVQNGQGIRICRSNEGELLAKDTLLNGEMVERVTYFPNGDPATITPFHNKQIHGVRLTYLQGGLPKTAEEWRLGKQEGITVIYLNGEKYAEIPYVNGKKEGIENRYRDGDLLVEQLTWKDDLPHGERKIFVDGEPRTEWFHQGELVSRATFERMNLPSTINR